MRLFEGTQFDRPPRCEACDQLESECTCPRPAAALTPAKQQTARLGIEKRKRGKEVTVVRDLLDEGNHLADLLTKLKNHCGAGGSFTDGNIEIQGNQLVRIREYLTSLGYRTKG